MEIAFYDSSFPAHWWDCFVCLLTGVTASLAFIFYFSPSFPSLFHAFCNHSSVSVLFFFPVDDVPPYFKMEPPQTQVHLERNRLVLTCMAEGSWPLEFKWLYNGTELTRFSLEYRWELAPYLQEAILWSFILIIAFLSTAISLIIDHFYTHLRLISMDFLRPIAACLPWDITSSVLGIVIFFVIHPVLVLAGNLFFCHCLVKLSHKIINIFSLQIPQCGWPCYVSNTMLSHRL